MDLTFHLLTYNVDQGYVSHSDAARRTVHTGGKIRMEPLAPSYLSCQAILAITHPRLLESRFKQDGFLGYEQSYG